MMLYEGVAEISSRERACIIHAQVGKRNNARQYLLERSKSFAVSRLLLEMQEGVIVRLKKTRRHSR